jgi:hypothetical protein
MNKYMLFGISIVLGIVFYFIFKKLFAPNPHKNFSKSHDFCLRVSKCKDHALPISKPFEGDNTEDNNKEEINILDHEDLITLKDTSKKMCNATAGTQKYRNKYKCFYNETGNSISDCLDCGSPINEKKGQTIVRKCANAGHDLLFEGNLPTFDECLTTTGYRKYKKESSPLDMYKDYNISIKEGTELNDEWWEKKDYLFKCIMGESGYIRPRYDSPNKEGDGVNSTNRYINCTHCSNISKNKKAFDECYDLATKCFNTNYENFTECNDFQQEFFNFKHL